MKEIIKANSLYLVINLLSAASAVLLIPLYVSQFSVEEYGLLALMNVFFSFMTILVTLNMESAIQTFYFDHNHDEQAVRSYFRSTFSFAVLISVGWIALLLVTGPFLFDLIFQNDSIVFYPNGLIVVLSSAVAAINQMYFVLLRNQERIRQYGRLVLVSTILNLSLQVLLIVVFKMNVTGALTGLLIANGVVFLIILLSTGHFTFQIKWSALSSSLKYSSWLLPFLLIQWFLAKGDRLIVENFLGLEEVGIFALLMNISMIISLVATSVLNSVRPALFQAFKEQALFTNRKVRNLFLYFLAIVVVTAFGVYIFIQLIEHIGFFEDYIRVKNYALLALALFTLRVIFRFGSEYLSFLKRSRDLSFLAVLNAIVFLGLLVWNAHNLTLCRLLEISLISNFSMLMVLAIRVIQLNKSNYALKH